MDTLSRTRPFLKWAGGKFRLLDKLQPHMKGRRLIEPFLGGGALFLNTRFDSYLLGDINTDLINVYQHLKKEKEQFIAYVKSFFDAENNTQKNYIRLRNEFNNGAQGSRRAALFIYLNRHGYNGLCRYNKSGVFNVPFGTFTKIYFPEKEMLHFVNQSKHANFVCGNFATIMNRARRGDLVYCDPPYVPSSSTAKFTEYAADGFSFEQQTELAHRAQKLANRGVKVIISNHDNELTRNIYQNAQIDAFSVQRFISRDVENRNRAKELLAIYE